MFCTSYYGMYYCLIYVHVRVIDFVIREAIHPGIAAIRSLYWTWERWKASDSHWRMGGWRFLGMVSYFDFPSTII